MATINNGGSNVASILKGRVVTLDQIRADNALIDSCKKTNYGVSYKYDPSSLPDFIDVNRFNKAECNNEKEVKVLQNAARCLKAMPDSFDTSILDEYANDTLLTFDFVTGRNLFDEDTFQKDLNEHKSEQLALIDEYNKIVATSTLLNAVENAKKLQQIKAKLAELQTALPKKEDAKYNHPEIVKSSVSVKQALDRYKELRDLRNKYDQDLDQRIIDYKHSHAGKLNISEDTFRIFKDLYNNGLFIDVQSDKFKDAVTRYESVKDYNENNWKEVSLYDMRDTGANFLNRKQLKLWQRFGCYNDQYRGPRSTDWQMYEHFNDTDLEWLTALKALYERVIALKRIEEQHADACEQSK